LITNNNKFRLDINALRTVAILRVLIFHFNSGYIPGGFAGVDVFFVISFVIILTVVQQRIIIKYFNTDNYLNLLIRKLFI
jgi:peptidoglycan/LPS O-acetylase OafA/YrhL